MWRSDTSLFGHWFAVLHNAVLYQLQIFSFDFELNEVCQTIITAG